MNETTLGYGPVRFQWFLVVFLLFGVHMFSIPIKEKVSEQASRQVYGEVYENMDGQISGVVSEEMTTFQSAVIPVGKEHYLRVMTFNIRHGKGLDGRVNLDRIVSDIEHGDPDIVALQEVDRFHIRSKFKDQVNILMKALDMDAYFSPSIYHYGFAEYGNALLSKYPLYNRKIEYLPGIKERRALLSAQVKIGNVEVTVFTTHLGVLEEEREMQMPIILDKLHEVKGPAIFLGDLNMDPSDALLESFVEPWKKAPLIHDTGTYYLGGEIDHIFTGPYVDTINAWTIETEASDHWPVVAELKVSTD